MPAVADRTHQVLLLLAIAYGAVLLGTSISPSVLPPKPRSSSAASAASTGSEVQTPFAPSASPSSQQDDGAPGSSSAATWEDRLARALEHADAGSRAVAEHMASLIRDDAEVISEVVQAGLSLLSEEPRCSELLLVAAVRAAPDARRTILERFDDIERFRELDSRSRVALVRAVASHGSVGDTELEGFGRGCTLLGSGVVSEDVLNVLRSWHSMAAVSTRVEVLWAVAGSGGREVTRRIVEHSMSAPRSDAERAVAHAIAARLGFDFGAGRKEAIDGSLSSALSSALTQSMLHDSVAPQETLETFKSGDDEQVTALLSQISFGVRRSRGRVKAWVKDVVVDALSSSSRSVRARATHVLARLVTLNERHHDAGMVDRLATAAQSGDLELRARSAAVRALVRLAVRSDVEETARSKCEKLLQREAGVDASGLVRKQLRALRTNVSSFETWRSDLDLQLAGRRSR